MSSDLLSIGASGVLAQQKLLWTTSNNISNINTQGYTRQSTTLYTNTTRVGWIIAGSLAGVVAEIWSYHAVFWIALVMGIATQACLWRIRDV